VRSVTKVVHARASGFRGDGDKRRNQINSPSYALFFFFFFSILEVSLLTLTWRSDLV